MLSRACQLIGVAVLAGGCSQTLKVTISRYDVDATPESRSRYEAARRVLKPVSVARAQVASAQAAFARYKSCVVALNALTQELFPGLPERDKAIKAKRESIEKAFKPQETALGTLAAALADQQPDASTPPIPEEATNLVALVARLKAENVETDPGVVRKVLGQLAALDSEALKAQAASMKPRLDAILSDPEMTCSPEQQKREPTSLDPAAPDRSIAFSSAFKIAFENRSKLAAERLGILKGGDLILRPYGVWQDLTDPYIMHIVSNPDQWKQLVESTTVGGSGDVEYVLVFESPLDARLKTVTVDPSKVVQARLSIARKVAQAAVAATGIATASFGVPLPVSAGEGKDGNEAEDTIDYSRMTAEEQVIRERNDSLRRRLENLKRTAAGIGAVRDVESAARALRFLQRELSSADAAAISM